jgi:hypothetical protein
MVAGAPPQAGWLYGCDGARLVTGSRKERDVIELNFWFPRAER